MAFGNGNKHGKGSKRAGAGRPTKEQAEIKRVEAEITQKWIEKNAEKLVRHYIARAMKSDRVLMHVMDKLVPDAKQTVGIEGGFVVDDLIIKMAEYKKRRNRG